MHLRLGNQVLRLRVALEIILIALGVLSLQDLRGLVLRRQRHGLLRRLPRISLHCHLEMPARSHVHRGFHFRRVEHLVHVDLFIEHHRRRAVVPVCPRFDGDVLRLLRGFNYGWRPWNLRLLLLLWVVGVHHRADGPLLRQGLGLPIFLGWFFRRVDFLYNRLFVSLHLGGHLWLLIEVLSA